MAEMRRVALLARPGEACERLRTALRDAGGEIVLEGDPLSLAIDALATAAPQAVLVALDPAVEDALERFDAVLGDPSIAVIYDEADLAARREGWDAARWVRHLSAKLYQHGDVLPPGHDPDDAVLPLPGRPTTPAEHHADAEFVDFASEALAIADTVPAEPRLGGIGVSGLALTDDINEMSLDGDIDPVSLQLSSESNASAGPSWQSGSGAIALADMEAIAAEADAHVEADAYVVAPAAGVAPRLDETPAELAAQPDDAASRARFHDDLAALEQHASGLQLADMPAPRGPEQLHGAVLVLAGIGGPDAVRQLLTALPAGFPRPILISQRLDGGRHDRLVQQMGRASILDVELAEADAIAVPGRVYIVPPELGVTDTDAGLQFTEGTPLLASMPAADSAVLLLSGSDLEQVDVAMALAGRGAMVAGQSPEGCYDGVAAQSLIARGGTAGAPADLAKRLSMRWLSLLG